MCCASTSRRATVRRSGDIGTTRSRRGVRRRPTRGRRRLERLRHGDLGGGAIAVISVRGSSRVARGPAACGRRPASRSRPPRPLPFTSSAEIAALGHRVPRRTAPLGPTPPFVVCALGVVGGRRRRRWRFDVAAPGADLIDLGDHIAHGDRLARLAQDLPQHARPGRRDLQRRLLALDLDQRLVGRDLVALGALPGAQRRLADRLARARERCSDECHSTRFLSANASSHRCRACSRAWRCRRARRRAGRQRPAHARPGERSAQQPRQLAVHVGPGAHVLRLFLHPDHRRALGVHRQASPGARPCEADTAARRARWRRRRSRAPRASATRS